MSTNVLELLIKASGASRAGSEVKVLGMSLTDLNSGISLLKQGAQVTGQVLDATVGKFANYAFEMGKLSTNIGLSVEETSRAIQGLDDLGVKAEAAGQMFEMASKNGFTPSIEALAQLADRTNAITDPTQRSAELAKIFGRNWAEIAPALARGGDAIRNATKSVNDGLVVTDEGIKAAQDYKKAVDDLNDSWATFTMAIGGGVIPKINDLLTVINSLLSLDSKNWFQEGAIAAQQFVTSFFGLKGKFGDLSDAIEDDEHLMRMYAQATKATVPPQKDLTKAVEESGYSFKGTMEEADAMIALMGAAPTELEAFAAGLNQVKDASDDTEKAQRGLFATINTGIDSVIKGYMDGLDFIRAGGGELTKITEQIKEAIIAGKITPDEGERLFAEAYVAAEKLKAKMGEITAYEAAKNISDTLGVSLDSALEKVKNIKELDNAQLQADVNITINKEAPGVNNDYWKGKLADPVEQAAKTAQGSIDAIGQSIVNLPSQKDIYIYTHHIDIYETTTAPTSGNGGKRRASGGNVNAYEPVVVGEEGPEIYVPYSSGYIVPNDQVARSGGRPTGQPVYNDNRMYVTNNNHTVAAAAIAQAQLRQMRANRLNGPMGG